MLMRPYRKKLRIRRHCSNDAYAQNAFRVCSSIFVTESGPLRRRVEDAERTTLINQASPKTSTVLGIDAAWTSKAPSGVALAAEHASVRELVP